jgi:hypothetical protein
LPTNILCWPYLAISDTCPADLSGFNLITLRSEDYKLQSLLRTFLRTPVTASLQTAPSTLYFHNPLFSSLKAGILNQWHLQSDTAGNSGGKFYLGVY